MGVVAENFSLPTWEFFRALIEIKPNTFIRDRNCYAYIQLIREKFWLQFWTLKKFSEPRCHACREITLLRNEKKFTILLRQALSNAARLAALRLLARRSCGVSIYNTCRHVANRTERNRTLLSQAKVLMAGCQNSQHGHLCLLPI